jgi:hypothetical protein
LELDCNESIEFRIGQETAELEVEFHRQENEFQHNFQIAKKKRCNKYEGKREANLDFYYENLNSIPPRSLEAERVFPLKEL